MSRPIKFALEVSAGLLIAAAGAYLAARFNGKFNRQNQAAERIAGSLETIADALERAPRRNNDLLRAVSNIRIIQRPAPPSDPCNQMAFMRIK